MFYRSRAVRARRGRTVARLGFGLHRYLVLVQQRAAPTERILIAPKLVRKERGILFFELVIFY